MRNKILIIDTNNTSRDVLSKILSSDYTIEQATAVNDAIDSTIKNQDVLVAILIDMIGTMEEGFCILEALSEKSLQNNVPIIVICNPTSLQMEERLYGYGIFECIRQPFNEKLIRLKIENIVNLFKNQKKLEDKINLQTKQLEMQYNLLKKEAEFLQQSNTQIIDLLGMMAEYRNRESGEHIQRIKGYTEVLANEYMNEFPESGLTKEKIKIIVAASSLHDIGKIAITDTILSKPGKLTDKEFEYMKSHTLHGCEILEKLMNVWSKEYGEISMEICRYHHERYDGKGYPDGLKGEDIPLSAQLVAVADVYDALVHERVYKAAIPKQQAFEMIIKGACGTFSPQLMQCFTNCRGELEKI